MQNYSEDQIISLRFCSVLFSSLRLVFEIDSVFCILQKSIPGQSSLATDLKTFVIFRI